MRKLLAFLLLTSSVFAQQQVQPVAGVLTLNLVPGTSSFKVILSANVTSVVIQNPTPGTIISVIFTENATGGFTVAFGGNIANPCSVSTTASTTTICQFQFDATSNTWNGIGGGGGGASISSIPGTPGLTAIPVQSGLQAEYRILPTESACAIVDYSGNGNNATGCVGTSPTINAVTGGLAANAAGAVNLPAALNSTQTAVLFIGNTLGNANGALLAGNGAAANSSIFSLTVFNNPSSTQGGQIDQAFAAGSRIFAGQMGSGNNIAFYPRIMVEGDVSVAWDMICDVNHANFDTIYVNGVDQGDTAFSSTSSNNFLAQRCSQGHQTVGNYQLLGIAGASCPNYTGCGYMSTGNIYYAAFWNRPLNAAEVASASQYMATAMQARGVTPTIFASTAGTYTSTMQVAIDGDSLSCGPCPGATPNPVAPYSSYLTLTNPTGGLVNITNMARAGYRLDTNLSPSAGFAIDPIFRPNNQNNVVVIWGGTNDGANFVPQMQSYCNARRAVGWKCIVVSMVSRTGLDATKNTANASIRQLWTTFADGFADVAADVNIGADGANTSATYFTNDHVHVQDVGIINDETPWIQRAINRLYGNRDFSAATVYASAAAAATATTAGSEATNTVTLTFGATPANCQIGNMITVAGTTPAGYSGNWLIRTRSATQVTYFAATAGMGAITVQGTGVCPQQQDADQYEIINFGAGNASLQSCVGLTGQNIYIRNINAASSTLLPFGSETITGAGATPTTLAANSTAILQSQLVSASAAGCNWVRLQ